MKNTDYTYLIFAIFFSVIVTVGVSIFFSKTQNELANNTYSTDLPQTINLQELSKTAAIDTECDTLNLLEHVAYTQDEIISVKLIDDKLCEMDLSWDKKIVYPSAWHAMYQKTKWPEISFYEISEREDNLPDITFRKTSLVYDKTIENSLDEFLTAQDEQIAHMADNDLLVSPLFVRDNVIEQTSYDFFGYEAIKVHVRASTNLDSYYYIFIDQDNAIWVAIFYDDELIATNKEYLSPVVTSIITN
ncbi:hypothetical protein IPM62_03455 [Candidatus Woesebacteria bacterium]|nr:MAG: hypothetical protein IPM62_03455 [Candidatus Woesebacteria bacterium]